MSLCREYELFPAYSFEIIQIPNIHKIKDIPRNISLKKTADLLKSGSGSP